MEEYGEKRELSQREEGDKASQELVIEGRNAVMEAFKANRSIDRLFLLDQENLDGPIKKIVSEARKRGIITKFETKERLDQLTGGAKHQGVVAFVAAYDYVELEDILELAREKGEPPFLVILDGIEDPHNLGAILRTANIAGVHGVVIPKRRAVGLTATVVKTSAGAVEYTPVARVTNVARTIEELKKEGIWTVCADMDGTRMYDIDMKGPLAIVIGKEGEGVSRLVKESCDFVASIPMKGQIGSLNASVAAGVLLYEALRQRD
ncbi:23S rRNA (guanosine(2251)-2'-O)-methyltransferase RlmB [Anaerotalea alkaliphila]|uniref:23S rRNA (Guanosine(2251)-2'-O)-methyltransferase RlmB n=1 Tax=Anaerotalea alkaliphila TaxID=2662126 RepID=A0A7X5KNV2_9FIRM|nr:23S rRNA (guanosine(2251)-2'-O)-methyltransferase RlmB [Anaerotalea alkaliphila]NDL68208.1 23S rRNA (guanosine(2251)-2'-O)-methyltransferase RlmB [Anaerotalea alkaliphila]